MGGERDKKTVSRSCPHTHVMFCALTSQTSRHDSRLPRSRPAVNAKRVFNKLALVRFKAGEARETLQTYLPNTGAFEGARQGRWSAAEPWGRDRDAGQRGTCRSPSRRGTLQQRLREGLKRE